MFKRIKMTWKNRGKNFGVDWLREKKNNGKESEENFEKETSFRKQTKEEKTLKDFLDGRNHD